MWIVTSLSAIIGGASHVAWDRLASAPVADLISSAIGAVITIIILIRLRYPFPPISWLTAALIFVAGAVASPFLPGAQLPHTTGTRILILGAIACTAGVFAAHHAP